MAGPKNNDLKSISELNSTWADRIAWLILVGLAVDIAEVIILRKPWPEWALTIGANVLIIFGVWGELWFSKRARDADDGRVAEANKAAEEARARAQAVALVLAKFRKPRLLFDEQSDRIAEALRKSEGISFAIAAARADEEILMFVASIANCLLNAGWRPEKWPAEVPGSIERELPFVTTVWIRIGGFPQNNVLVLFSAENELTAAASDLLASLLRAEEISVFRATTVPGVAPVLIIVGPKT